MKTIYLHTNNSRSEISSIVNDLSKKYHLTDFYVHELLRLREQKIWDREYRKSDFRLSMNTNFYSDAGKVLDRYYQRLSKGTY